MLMPNTTHVNPAGLRPIPVKRGLSLMLVYCLSMVMSYIKLAIFALAPFLFSSAFGQTIDQGRGTVQLNVPQNYNEKTLLCFSVAVSAQDQEVLRFCPKITQAIY